MSLLLRLWMVCALLLPALPAAAVVVPESFSRLDLTPSLQWLPQPSVDTLAAARAQDDAFIDIIDDANLGRLPGAWWFRTELHNAAPVARDLLLAVEFDKLEQVDLYLVRAGVPTERFRSGTGLPFAARPVATAGHLFPLPLAPGETVTVYLHAAGGLGLVLPTRLYTPAGHAEQHAGTHWWQGLLYGLVLGLLAYNASLWYYTRDRAFLYFVLTGVTGLGYFAGFDGVFYRLLPGQVLFHQQLMFLAGMLSVWATLQFGRHFLHSQRHFPRLDRLMLLLGALALVAVPLLPLLPLTGAMTATIVLSLLMVVLMLAAGWLALRQSLPLAGIFMGVFLLHLLVLSLLATAALGMFSGLFEFATGVHRVSLTLILALFSVALGERVRSSARARRQAEAELLHSRAQARARNDFLAKMSHELRTPMTGVLGMAELLEHTDLAPQQRRYLSTLRYSGEMLLNLINDVLDHARIEAGRLQIRREAFDLLRLVDECRLLFEQQPRDNGVTLRIDIGAGVPRVASGDAQRIRQVLVNLLGNAFKFTSSGSVSLRLRPREGGRVRFEVEDTGIGIAPADRARLFEMFAQSAEGAARQGGSGLGLAICRQLCTLMGGQIGVESEPGKGSLFWFELPLHADMDGE